MKNRLEACIMAAILCIFLLSAAGIYVCVKNYTPAAADPGTGIPGEKQAYRDSAIAFVRENEDLLHRAMQEARALTGGRRTIDLGRSTGTETHAAPVLRVGFEDAAENAFLKALLEDTIIESIHAGDGYTTFSLDYSSGIVTSSLYYDILYCTGDPAPVLYPEFGDDWKKHGSGRVRSSEDGHVDFYLEEIGGGFWYSFISWP